MRSQTCYQQEAGSCLAYSLALKMVAVHSSEVREHLLDSEDSILQRKEVSEKQMNTATSETKFSCLPVTK
jgi:hypothetical protein